MIRLLLALGILLVAQISYSQTLTELQTFRGSDTPNETGIVFTRFGFSMDMDGNTLVVTEPYNGGGLAYVFELVNNQWTEVAKLTASDNAGDDNFGLSVAIEGDVIVVGSPNKEATVTLEGAVYIYEKPVSGWASATETIKLVSPNAGAISSFGSSVDVSGDELLIGALNEDVGAVANAGRIYVYTRTTSSWTSATIEAELTTSSIGAGDKLGGQEATFEDDYIVSSALTGSNAGTLHIYEKPASGTWVNATVEDQLLLSATRSMDDRLGGLVHASDDFIVTLSADDFTTPMNYEPRMHVFHRATGKWSTELNVNEVVNYALPSYFSLPSFGLTGIGNYSIKSIGDILLIGNGASVGPSNTNSSGSLLITRYGSQASDFQTIVEVDGTDFNSTGEFGGEIAISGSKVIVASNRENIGGVVRFFDFSYSVSATENLCPGQSYSFGSQTITTSGVYNESFTASDGLDSLVTLTVSVSDLAISTSKTDNICFGESNGEISVGASGGTSPYQYSIDGTNYGSSPSFPFLSAGNYTLYVRDSNGCIESEMVTITEPAQLVLDQVSVTDCECFGEASGVINVSVLGGTGAVEFSTDGTNFAPAPLTGIAAGTYNITARDANGCEVVVANNVAVGQPAATLTPVIAGAPSIGSTVYGTPLTGIQVTPNVSDPNTTHFMIATQISTSGRLFKSDGVTELNVGDFITVAEGAAGLVWDPNVVGPGSFFVQSAAADRAACVGGSALFGQIGITKAPLTAQMPDQSVSYGNSPDLTVQYSGFVNGEDESNLDATITVTNTVTNSTTPGSYPIAVTGTVDANYDITFVNGTVTVTKAPLQTTAGDASMTYGDDNLPALSFGYTGFVNGEDDSVLDTEPSGVSTTATIDSDAGTYPIQVAQDGADDNYDFTYVDGELTIDKATITSTADDQTINEGEALPAFSVSHTGFVNNEDVTDLDAQPMGSVSIADSSVPGEYTITVSGGSDNNYDFSYVSGQLTINEVLSIIDDIPDVSVFPNPVAEEVKFDQKIHAIELLTLEGKLLMEVNEVERLDVRNLKSGTYLIRLLNESNELILITRILKR